jgi:cytochrome c biogenesis protein CcmG/thiol:disulfide interchange protein DsbE
MTAPTDAHPGSDEDQLPAAVEGRAPRGSSLPRAWLIVAATLPVVLLVALGIFLATRGGPTGSQIGAQAPGFTLQDLDGNAVSLADLRGRPVMVNFWASWCVPCVEEFPLLEQAQAEHTADGLAIVGIVYRDSAGAARDFMQRMGADWPTLIDPDETVANEYGIIGPPETFFIDQGGTVAARQIGLLTATDLQRHLARILVEE